MNNDAILNDALHLLSMSYKKIIRVNLTTEEYEYVGTIADEWQFSSETEKISELFNEFAETTLLYSEDKTAFLSITDVNNLRELLANNHDDIKCVYRRMLDCEYHKVLLKVIKSKYYDKDNEFALILIRDMNGRSFDDRSKADKYDQLTGLGNRHLFELVCGSIIENYSSKPVGIISANINALKYVNETQGMQAGDELINKFKQIISARFGAENCFRLSGDGFMIVLQKSSIGSFFVKANEFVNLIQSMNPPLASIGFSYAERGADLNDAVDEARERMNINKQTFCQLNPKYIR